MTLVCGTCGTELHNGAPCVSCRAADGRLPELPVSGPARIAVLTWLQPHAQAALATGRLSLILRTWRSMTGTPQAEIANALGYDTSYISAIENNCQDERAGPGRDPEVLARWSDPQKNWLHFGCHPADLSTIGAGEDPAPGQSDLIEAWRRKAAP